MSMKSLTGIRGICSIIIVIGHFFTKLTPTLEFTLDYLSPVSLFFVQSGFLLGLFYQDKLDSYEQRVEFWVKRFAKIAPMYYFSLLLTIPDLIIFLYPKKFDFSLSLAFTPLFLQSLTIVGGDWNFPLWQISAFMMCYALYPFLLKPLKSKYGITIGIASIAFQLASFMCFYFQYPQYMRVAHRLVLIRSPSFIIGVILGLKISLPKEVKSEKEKKAQLAWNKYTVGVELVSFLLAAIAAASISIHYFPFMDPFDFMYWTEFTLSPIYCLWFYFICKSPEVGFTIPFFSSWLMVNLGEISYSLYVIQWPVMEAYEFLMNWSWEYPGKKAATHDIVGIISSLICISMVCYHYIEDPARKWIANKFSPKTRQYQEVSASKPQPQMNRKS